MSIEDLINHIGDQDFTKAGPSFIDVMNSKISDAFDAERAGIAQAMFSDQNVEDEDDYEPDDEDMEEFEDDEFEDESDEEDE